MRKLNEKRIELSSPYPVKSDEIIDFIDRTNRLICKEIDNKTIQLYIYTKRRCEHDAFAEVEITSTGYILHGDEGYDYQGTSIKEFNNDLNEIILHYDLDVFPKKFGENTINKENLFESLLNEADDSYIAKVGGLYLQGKDLTSDPEEADVFESKTEPTQRINQMKKDGKIKKNKKISIIKESKEAAYALTKLKALLKFDTRWVYAGDGEPYLVDNENDPPLYTVQWTGNESGSHQGFYSVDVEEDDEWDSTIYNFSDERSTYEKIEDVMKSSSLNENKKVALFGKLLKE